MKHIANVMRTNDWNINQESTIGKIIEKGRGKTRRYRIEWLDGAAQEFKNYYDACVFSINGGASNFVRPV